MYCLCIILVFQRHLTMYLNEIIHLANPSLFRWRFLFLKAYLSVQKESIPLHITSTNILNHVTKEESRGVRIVKTSFRLFVRGIK